jgi:hypothetical protein
VNALTWIALAIVAAFAVAIGLWGIQFFLEAAAVFAVVIATAGVRNRQRAGRVIEDARSDVGDDTLAMLGGKLPGPDRPQASGAGRDEDTGVMAIDDEYRALLDKEGGRG